MTGFVTAAPLYTDLGWKVLPLGEGSKLPLAGTRGVKDATLDVDLIRRWGQKHPRANVGIACGEASRIVVVDVDPRNAGDTSIRALAARGYSFPKGPRQRAGNGGWHLFFQHQPGIGGSKNKLGRGIDLKSTGGYVLVAPSRTDHRMLAQAGLMSGRSRRSTCLCRACRSGCRRCCAPAPRPKSAFTPDVNRGDIEPLARFVAASTKGERNSRLHWAACRAGEMAARCQVSAQSAGNRLVAAAAAAGYFGSEVVNTIDSGFQDSGLRYEGRS